VGGLIAPAVGLRRSFLITAAFYLVAMMTVGLLYREPRTRHAREATRSLWSVFRELVSTPGFVLALAVIFTLQTVDRSFSPILPLFIEQLGIAGDRIATVSGFLFSLVAVCAAIGHKVAGSLMARYSPRLLVTTVAVSTAMALLVIVVLPSMWTLTAALIVASLGIGVAMTAAYSLAGALLPADAHVTGFGIMTTASLVGLAFSPVLAGFVGASGLMVVFIVDVVLLVVLAVITGLKLQGHPGA
jgi:MFS family permease